MDQLIRDVRVGLRALWKDRTFTATAVFTLAACLAANLALFAVVEGVVLRPLPVPEPDRIVLMANQYPKAGAMNLVESAGVADYLDRLRDVSALETQALVRVNDQSIDQGGHAVRARILAVTPSFFSVARVAPLLGRTFSPTEGELGRDQKVVLSYGLWQSQFGGAADVVGRTLRIDNLPQEVVGVMPRSFVFMDDQAVAWRALAFREDEKNARHNNDALNIGRLKPGATIAQVQAQIDALNAANLERFPEWRKALADVGFRTRVVGLQDHLVGDVKATLFLLWGGALFVLLVGCVNVAALVLMRTRSRIREVATRVALGAGRARLARHLFTETTLLTLGSVVPGLALGYLLLLSLGATNIDALPRATQIGFGGTVAAYGVGLAVALAVVLASAPFVAGLRANIASALGQAGRSGTAGRGSRALRRGLIVTQIGMTFVLLVGAGLLSTSLRRVLAVDRGFGVQNVLTATVSLPYERYPDDASVRQFMDRATRALKALPGVVSLGSTNTIPLSAASSTSVIVPEDRRADMGASTIAPMRVVVTPGLFEAMGVRLVRGRFFDSHDRPGSQGVIIVDEKLAQRLWPGQDPLGRRLFFPTDPSLALKPETPRYSVVGVIHDVRIAGLVEGKEEVGAYYLPFDQMSPWGGTWGAMLGRKVAFAIRTTDAPEQLTSAVRGAIGGVDRELAVYDVRTMADWEARSVTSRRAAVTLSLGFGTIALLLSVVGIYGMLAYSVVQRSKEIGIRMALGGAAADVFALIVSEGAILIVAGFVLGGLGALALRKVLETQLYGVAATDPVVMLTAAAVLALAALAACLLPARRATRVAPSTVLSE